MELNATAFQGMCTKAVVVNIAISKVEIPKHHFGPNKESDTSELHTKISHDFSHIHYCNLQHKHQHYLPSFSSYNKICRYVAIPPVLINVGAYFLSYLLHSNGRNYSCRILYKEENTIHYVGEYCM